MKSLNPGTERPRWCDDWGCPARRSCANHFGRSEAYAKMAERHAPTGHGAGTHFWRGVRDHCPKYELDKPRAWLMPQPGQTTHAGPFHGDFVA